MRAEQDADFEWWFRASYPGVVRTVHLLVHDRAQAEELTQDAFVKMLQRWSTVSRYERPDAWVRRVAVRMAIRSARRERVRDLLERDGLDQRDQGWPDLDLARAVAQLAPMQRAAVVLHYHADQPVLEIARILQVSESTVKQHLLRARRRLAELLGEEVSEDVG